MRQMQLDFVPGSSWWLWKVLLLISVALLADAAASGMEMSQALAALERQAGLHKRQLDRLQHTSLQGRTASAFSPDESKALRQTAREINADWDGLFRRIEAATTEDIALLAIRPNRLGKTVSLAGEARNLPAAFAFVDALRGDLLQRVTLVSHQIKQNDPQNPIVFEISALWQTD